MPEFSKQFSTLPPYALADVPKVKAELIEQGVDIIDLGAGDADQMPPAQTIEAIRQAVTEERFSRYPFQRGLPEFRIKIAEWMARRFGFEVDPFEEVLPLIGTKEGIAHLPLVYMNPGDGAIIPDPGYYPYFGGTHMLGADVIEVPLRREKGYLLDWSEVPKEKLARAKLLYLNYPNNPTGGIATDDYFQRALEFCREHDLLLVSDNAYSEIAFDGYRPPSVLQYEGAREVAVEYHSLSKTFNMTGWRIGWVAGTAWTLGKSSYPRTSPSSRSVATRPSTRSARPASRSRSPRRPCTSGSRSPAASRRSISPAGSSRSPGLFCFRERAWAEVVKGSSVSPSRNLLSVSKRPRNAWRKCCNRNRMADQEYQLT
jgi:LL-diaminopimelate aminotransferase